MEERYDGMEGHELDRINKVKHSVVIQGNFLDRKETRRNLSQVAKTRIRPANLTTFRLANNLEQRLKCDVYSIGYSRQFVTENFPSNLRWEVEHL
jgi:hypothetical protein